MEGTIYTKKHLNFQLCLSADAHRALLLVLTDKRSLREKKELGSPR